MVVDRTVILQLALILIASNPAEKLVTFVIVIISTSVYSHLIAHAFVVC